MMFAAPGSPQSVTPRVTMTVRLRSTEATKRRASEAEANLAAAEAIRDLPFLLTARAENYLWERPDLDDTIRRLQAVRPSGLKKEALPVRVERLSPFPTLVQRSPSLQSRS